MNNFTQCIMSYKDAKLSPNINVDEFFSGEYSEISEESISTASIASLPLVHITDGLGFRQIIDSNSLIPNDCKVFKEKLLYFSYGRPVFRANSEVGANKQGHYFPVCIVLKPDSLELAKRIFPFDSGAFDKGLFKDFMHKDFTIEDFSVDPNPNYPGQVPISNVGPKIVEVFFKNNTKYYKNNEFREQLKFINNELCFEALSFYELIKSAQTQLFDDRRSTIEIQTDATISLSSEIVSAVVLPKPFLNAEKVRNKIIKEWRAEPLDYTSFTDTPAAFIPVIRDKIGGLLIERGIIGDYE